MKSIRSYLLLLQAVLLWLETSGFQSPSAPDSAAKLLDSQDVSERAWGAYFAGQSGLLDLQPKLESILEEAATSDECLVRSAIEAEIRMRADLPTSLLAEIYGKYPDETTILLAQSPENHIDLILSLFQNQGVSARWLALGNLLLEAKAPGFPLALIQDLKRIHIVVSVRDPTDRGGGFGGGWGQGAGDFNVPIGYPPVTVHNFSDRSSPDATVIAKGTHSIYATQTIIYPGESARIGNGGGFIADYWESNAYRLEYLSSLLHLPQDDIRFNKYFTLDWNGPIQFMEDVTALCSRILEKYDRILARLQDDDLISRADAETLENSILVKFNDVRRDKNLELPNINLNRVAIDKQ
jgi:hypothetical protein